MATISVKVDMKQVNDLLEDMARRGKNLRPLFARMWAGAYEEVMINFRKEGSYGDVLSGAPSYSFTKWQQWSKLTRYNRTRRGTSAGGILQDSNRLRMSIGTVRKITDTVMEIGTDTVYGRIQHFGGKILPKKAKYLTIPIGDVKGSARSYSNTIVLAHKKSGKKKLVIYQKLPDGGLKPLFYLSEGVKIPARPYMTIGSARIDQFGEMAADYMVYGPSKIG